MTQARATKRRTILERNAAEVAAILATGETHASVAAMFKVERSSVSRFADRHAEDIAALAVQVEKAIEDYHIARKVNRIAELDHIYGLMRAEVDEFGLAIVAVDYHYDKEGKETGRTETRDFRGPLIREMRGVMRDAAEELAQIPRTPDNINVNVAVGVQLVWQDGDEA